MLYQYGGLEHRYGSDGLVGYNYGTITAYYSLSSVPSGSESGGLLGQNSKGGTVSNCYSAGPVSATCEAGGFLANNRGTVTSCFWDIETSGQTESEGGTGKTTAEMKQQATFEGWDFVNTWDIVEWVTYPFLRPAQ